MTATVHQGCLRDATTGAIARWHYTIEPVYGWGQPGHPPLPTAGWLSYLPILEPGWQVMMAHGYATGWADWQERRYTFTRVPVYAEKNWGGAFPERWWWIQCNAFQAEPDLTLTAVGARRGVLGHLETVGMVGLHYHGQFIDLTTLRDRVTWQVASWGSWAMEAENHRYRVAIVAQSPNPPTQVRVPTLTGLQWQCWDTTHGHITLTVWRRSPAGTDQLWFTATSDLAGLEVGGQGWEQTWTFSNF